MAWLPPVALPPRPAAQHGELDIDGQVRTYRVFAPTTLEAGSTPPPVLVLGGVGNSAEHMVSATETANPLVPYEGVPVGPEGVATQPAPPTRAVVERWAALNGCPTALEEETEAPVSILTWRDCGGGTAVKLVTIEGGGHTQQDGRP